MTASDNLFERIAPQNTEAEMCALGSMLLDSDAIGLVVQKLKPAYFYKSANRVIYETMIELYDASTAVDLVILRDALAGKGVLDTVGGAAYLAEIAQAVPSAAHADKYADIIREKFARRSLIHIATGMIRDAHDSPDGSPELLDRIERDIFEIADSGLPGKSYGLREILKDVFKEIERYQDMHDRERRITGLATGFYDLDDITSGLQDGELIIVAARPSVGKTTLALNIAERVAIEERKGVGVFSLEMGRRQIGLNMLCSCAGIDAHKLRRGRLGENDYDKFTMAMGQLGDAPIFIDDTSVMTVLQLRAKARRLKRHEDVGLIVVDYIQLMDSPVRENRQQQISEISRGLKALARELQIPVVALSQLNRAVDQREGGRPRLSDLRESGAIEQDADVVVLLHRSDYQQEKHATQTEIGQDDEVDGERDTTSTVDVIFAKQRNGPTGTVKLTFRRNILRYENYAGRASDVEPTNIGQF